MVAALAFIVGFAQFLSRKIRLVAGISNRSLSNMDD